MSEATWERLNKRHEEIRFTIAEAKKLHEQLLLVSITRRAEGEYYEDTQTVIEESNGKTKKKIVKIKKYIPGDVGAGKYLLSRLRGEKYNENKEMLEIAFANVLESNNAFYEFANMSDLYEYSNTVAQIQVALALNVVFTESNKTLINTSVDLIFNEIMSHEFILNFNNLTETSVNESKIRFKAELEIFYTDIARVSGFDFYNLTPAQKDDFSSIWQFGETPQTN